MGRYYNGDINGKFWFAVQNSDAADQFGVVGRQPDELIYYFDESNIQDITNRLTYLKDALGDYKTKLDRFFDKVPAYNEKTVEEHGMDYEEFEEKVRYYADLQLGEKILKCIEDKGECEFIAEC